jgi:hypothetical protein
MACNCKNTITSFLGGDVANPTTFLNCGEADGTYNNPLETGKTQCIAENNVLRVLDEYKISGTVKNAGEVVFERTVTGNTDGCSSTTGWTNDGTYYKPSQPGDVQLSAETLNTRGAITAGGVLSTGQHLKVGTHNGSDVIYIEQYSSASPYGQFFAGTADNNVPVGFRFVSRDSSGTLEESFTLLGDDKKATFQGNLVVSGANTTLNTLSATGINVGNGNGTISAQTITGVDTYGTSLYTSRYIYHTGDLDTLIDFTNNKIVLQSGGLSFIEADKKGSAPHEITFNDGSNNIDVVFKGNGSNAGNPGMKFDASTNMVGINGVGSPGYELDVDGTINSRGNLIVTGNTVMNGTLSATTSATIGNGDGTVSANTFTAPSISIGKESGVITGTTIVGKYSGATIQSSAGDQTITMTVAKFRPNMIIEVMMGGGAGDVVIILPAGTNWKFGKYTFIFAGTPNAGSTFSLRANGSEKMFGMSMCLDGNEIIDDDGTLSFGTAKTINGTKIEVTSQEDLLQTLVFLPANKADITPS